MAGPREPQAQLCALMSLALGQLEACTYENNVCRLRCFSHVRLFVALWTVARQAPLSMGFSRQDYWSGLPCRLPGDLLDPRIDPRLFCLLHLQEGSLPLAPPGKLEDTKLMEKKKKNHSRKSCRLPFHHVVVPWLHFPLLVLLTGVLKTISFC